MAVGTEKHEVVVIAARFDGWRAVASSQGTRVLFIIRRRP